MQVSEGIDILWEGELPSSLSVLTPQELHHALQKQSCREAEGATASGKHRSGHSITVSNTWDKSSLKHQSWSLNMTHVQRAQGQHTSCTTVLGSCVSD